MLKKTKPIDKKSQTEWKKKYSFALKEHLKKGNWEKIEELLPLAERFKVAGGQLRKSWQDLGLHQKEQDKLVSAVVSFAAARKHGVDDDTILAELLDCISGFVDRFHKKFSREDLVHLENSVDKLYSYHKTDPNTSKENLRRATELLARIRTLKEEAGTKRETQASAHVERICDALYDGMTHEEVKKEFARIVAPLIRKKLAESDRAAEKKTSSDGGKKPPKDDEKDQVDDEDGKKKE